MTLTARIQQELGGHHPVSPWDTPDLQALEELPTYPIGVSYGVEYISMQLYLNTHQAAVLLHVEAIGTFCSFSAFDTVGWVIWPVKTRSHMTYNVFGGTLSLTQSINQSSTFSTKCRSCDKRVFTCRTDFGTVRKCSDSWVLDTVDQCPVHYDFSKVHVHGGTGPHVWAKHSLIVDIRTPVPVLKVLADGVRLRCTPSCQPCMPWHADHRHPRALHREAHIQGYVWLIDVNCP